MNRFSNHTIAFLKRASRQKHPDWLKRNQAEYDELIRLPLLHLAETVSRDLRPLAPDYHFPKRGLGRIRRAAHRIAQHGGGLYKDWFTYSASRPRVSRFENNPNLYFLVNSEDLDDPVLVAGGLYMPSSHQTRKIREAIATNASAFDRLFASKAFAIRFKGGFSNERISSRIPRGFDPGHPRMNWLRLQGFFVWRPYSQKEFASPHFGSIVADDFRQILRLNRLLEAAVAGQIPTIASGLKRKSSLMIHLQDVEAPRRVMDF